ncbi:mast cell protease 1A-like [Osmerus eperlanus]|uniref:mast cell protease 1A-like n=1 Tax=Osmerus eperlanus TaxID=29151 RepID=UPI002E103443
MAAPLTLLLTALLSHQGLTGVSRTEIINGQKAGRSLFPFMASVQNNLKPSCGGVLIQKNFVLTAAHCDKGNLSVVLGSHNIGENSKGAVRFAVERKCIHPSFKNVKTGNDIMLLKLSKKVKPIKVARIPTKPRAVGANIRCHLAGWGATETSVRAVDDLRVVNVSTVDLDVCRKQWQDVGLSLPDNVVCAGGYKSKNGACQGDSGGPLVCAGEVVGVVSFNMKKNCDYPNVPNIHTQVSSFLSWIRKVLNSSTC